MVSGTYLVSTHLQTMTLLYTHQTETATICLICVAPPSPTPTPTLTISQSYHEGRDHHAHRQCPLTKQCQVVGPSHPSACTARTPAAHPNFTCLCKVHMYGKITRQRKWGNALQWSGMPGACSVTDSSAGPVQLRSWMLIYSLVNLTTSLHIPMAAKAPHKPSANHNDRKCGIQAGERSI